MADLDDVDKYVDEWTRVQLLIWQEKIERMGVVRSGALHQSFRDSIKRVSSGAGATTITMKFLKYGIYQALGVGNGYRHNNGGDLQILNKDYRKDNGLNKSRQAGPMPGYSKYMTSGKPRKKRDWYSKKLFMSTMAMVEDLGRILGEEAAHVICDQLTDIRSALS